MRLATCLMARQCIKETISHPVSPTASPSAAPAASASSGPDPSATAAVALTHLRLLRPPTATMKPQPTDEAPQELWRVYRGVGREASRKIQVIIQPRDAPRDGDLCLRWRLCAYNESTEHGAYHEVILDRSMKPTYQEMRICIYADREVNAIPHVTIGELSSSERDLVLDHAMKAASWTPDVAGANREWMKILVQTLVKKMIAPSDAYCAMLMEFYSDKRYFV
ncbi:hypothetical protein BD626DRAFT_472950 [Schizophyllum amplum]|uniref:Uncharacterized protein n=1 Tax=Schizophyllum amplum TaxID=97359 RepID=A0A550CWE1_9AGAR|nr:hypothetical protein BD626DRAFT_472950 [Auriculariopsis ampla]